MGIDLYTHGYDLYKRGLDVVINYNEAWKMKSQLIIQSFLFVCNIYLHAWFVMMYL